MQLARHGLQKLEAPVRVFAPSPDGRALALYTDRQTQRARSREIFAERRRKVRRVSKEYRAGRRRIAAQLLKLTPPVIEKPSNEDIWKLLKIGRKVRGLGQKRNDAPDPLGPDGRQRISSPNFSKPTCCAALSPRAEFSGLR